MQRLKTEITQMCTNELEVYIDTKYEAGAQQAELEALETAYAERVSEDEIDMTEDEPDMAEGYDMGVDLEEWLAIEYHQYTHPQDRIGGRETKDYFSPECINDCLSLHLKSTIKRKDILSAAKDTYQYKTKLIQRQKSKTKLNHIPTRLSKLYKNLDKIRPQYNNTN